MTGVYYALAQADTSGEFPTFMPNLRLGEFVASLALAQDNAFGQPLESQLRSCLLATWLCEAAGFTKDVRDTTYWVAQLRYGASAQCDRLCEAAGYAGGTTGGASCGARS
jgi:hypothetical protein